MRLNIGSGNRRLPGYRNIDAVPRAGVDMVAPADEIPLPDACADEVLAVHLLEHFFEWEVPEVLTEWARLLRPGGLLVLELPDLLKCARNLCEQRPEKKPGQLTLWGIYGDATLKDPWMMHKSGWWFERLAPVVQAVGFVDISEHDTQYHPTGRGVRDFRLEARKP